MSMQQIEHSHVSGRDVRPLNLQPEQVSASTIRNLSRLGINISDRTVRSAMDALISPFNAATIATPNQFLQQWLPGLVYVMTAARKIDELIGITTVGSWEQEEVIQTIIEPTGKAQVYADYTPIPLTNWNPNFERRTIVRFESGMMVAKQEEARAAALNINTAAQKREAVGLTLDIQRNLVGFFGFNDGNNRTFGFLNEVGLPAYVTVATGTGGTTWATKTFLEITADLRTAIAALRTQSQDTIDPVTTNITLAVPTNCVDRLTVTSDFALKSVMGWLNETYPRVRVVSAPQLNNANGGANVFYLFADTVNDGSTDNRRTFDQIVPSRFNMIGVEQRAKGYAESYMNALAGVIVKRPYAIVRRSGI